MNKVDDLKDIAAETTVIASLLNHPEFILHTDWLKAKHFSQTENGAIYWAIDELYKKGITNIDLLNISNQLNSNESTKKLMTEKNLLDLNKYMELAPLAARDSIEEYTEFCETIVNYAYKRALYNKANELSRLCFAPTQSLQDTDNKVHHIMSDLTEEYMITTDLRTLGDQADELFAEVIKDQDDDRFGVESKFEVFSPYFRYERGECIVLAARMKTGKSAFILNEAIYQAMKGVPTLVIDTELTNKVWYKRALCHISGVEFRRIRDGHWTEEESHKIHKANDIIKSLPLVHYYMPVVDMHKTYAMCKLLKYKMNLQFLCFDYIKGDDTDAFALSNKLGQMTNILKNEIAGELDMCVLAACQLNRQNEVSSSDKIAMYASTVLRWRFKLPSEIAEDGGLDYGNVYAQIYYNRNGEMQDKDEWMNLKFIGNLMTIVDCKQNKTQDTPFDSQEEVDNDGIKKPVA